MFDIRAIQEQVLYENVRAASNEQTASEVVYSAPTGTAVSDAEWVASSMQKLEQAFDKPAVDQIRMRCQCGYGIEERLTLIKELIAASSSLEEFAGHEKARAAGMFYRDGALYLQFFFCPCPMLATLDRLESDTWCQCTRGYTKVLFERAFGCEVEVELLKSIKTGGDVCLQRITPKGAVWRR
jgi:predicted hydrocarbon binding protein